MHPTEGERLARIETLLTGMETDREQLQALIAGQDSRLDRIERVMWLALGIAGASVLPDSLTALINVAA